MIDFELMDYYGLKLFFNPDEVVDEKAIYKDFEARELIPEVRFRFLKTKFFIEELSEEETAEFQKLLSQLGKELVKSLLLELQKASESKDEIKKYYSGKAQLLYSCLSKFEKETLIAGQFPVWWDIERFLHIYTRHVKETQVGSRNEGKSVFQYKFQDVLRIIKIVLEKLEEEIVAHFKNSTQIFLRKSGRATYYDGHYYRVEIEASGRLLTFHPYNDDKEREADD